MPDPMVLDLSHHNTIDDWDAISASGIVGVIYKATEGSDYADPTYAAARESAIGAGLAWGAYHFLRPGDMVQQARFFLATARPDENTLLAADHEDSGVSLDDLKTFLSCVRDATGNSPVLYSGNVLKEQIGPDCDTELQQYRLWLAQYSSMPYWPTTTWKNWWLWQYDGDGTNPGIDGAVDLNCYAKGEDDLTAEWAGKPQPPVERQTVRVSINAPLGVSVAITVNGWPVS